MAVVAIAAAVGAVAGVATAVSSGQQQKRKNLAELNLATLDARNQVDLQKALQKTDDQNAKAKIIADSVTQIKQAQATARIQANIQAKALQQEADKKNTIIITIGGGVVLLGAILVLRK
jgi:3-dehydroquinate synthetase